MSTPNPIEAGLIERLSSAIDALGERIFALPKPLEEVPGSDRSMRPCVKGRAERDALIGAFQLVDCLSGSLHEEASHLSQTVNELRERNKRLEHCLRMVVSHASGGALSEPGDIDRSLNDICVEISRHKNEIWKHAQESARKEDARARSEEHKSPTEEMDNG